MSCLEYQSLSRSHRHHARKSVWRSDRRASRKRASARDDRRRVGSVQKISSQNLAGYCVKQKSRMDLLFGDCLQEMKKIEDGSVDLLLADLPYGTTACKWDTQIPFEPLWEQLHRVCKKNAAMVFTSTMSFAAPLITSNIKNFKYDWVWEKPQGTNPLNAKKMPLRSHESVLVFYRQPPTYYPQMGVGTPYSGFSSTTATIGEIYGSSKSFHRDNPTGERYPKTIIKFRQEKALHPTQKPVPLIEYLIRTYSNVNELVLDPTMGSGTTGIACINTDRQFIGIEKDEQYFNIAKRRITHLRKYFHRNSIRKTTNHSLA